MRCIQWLQCQRLRSMHSMSQLQLTMKNENTFNIFIKLRNFGIKKSCSKLRDMPSACLPCFSWFLMQSTGQTCYTVPNSTRVVSVVSIKSRTRSEGVTSCSKVPKTETKITKETRKNQRDQEIYQIR